ncbi:hypothetical protein F2981_21215 (plasmid) [Sinorhizobium meliloti]|nr:hypothetical protein [Sinorhizobium meliloti]
MAWQDSLYSMSVYAVPKGAPNAAAGQALIGHFISDIEGQESSRRQDDLYDGHQGHCRSRTR